MSLLETKINETISNKLFVDIYRDHLAGEEALFSRVIKKSEEILQLSVFNNDGEFDGLSFIYISDITRLRWKGNERISIEKLVQKKSEKVTITEYNLSSIKTIVEELSRQFEMITIYTEAIDSDICFIGKLEAVDDEYILLNEYGTMKSLDRAEILLKLEDITRIDVNGKYERNLLYLFNEGIKD